MEAKLLVTTSIEESWGLDQHIVFLGEWCKRYSRKHVWQQRAFDVCDYHWRDRKKLQVDHDYLEVLNEDLLRTLGIFLNAHHGIDRDVEYWRIIIGPWLLTYLPVLWDRWEVLSGIAENGSPLETQSLTFSSNRKVPNDFSEALAFFDSDFWNHQIFIEIIRSRDDLDIEIYKLEIKATDDINIPTYRQSRFKRTIKFVLKIIDQIIEIFSPKKRKLVFYQSYFPRLFLAKLFLGLWRIPRSESRFEKIISYPDSMKREGIGKIDCNLSLEMSRKNFEKFVLENILLDIPVSYLEGYSVLFKKQSQLNDAENIFTANAHFANELFKVWAAEQKYKGSNLIISSHGGALYPLYSVFDHQEKIADYRIVWGLGWMKGQIRMPPNKLHSKVSTYDPSGSISLIDYDGQKYSYRCTSLPMGPLSLKAYHLNLNFINQLSEGARKHIQIRTFPFGAWEKEQRYIDDFGLNIISQDTLANTISSSRLVICTYPQTTFSEAMYSGVPTMILYDEKFWEVQPIYKELVQLLKVSGIMYTDEILAAQHVDSIVNDPMEWWNNPKTVFARKKFNELCLTIDPNPLDSWVELFRSISKEGSAKR